jgi:hypothetical protein
MILKLEPALTNPYCNNEPGTQIIYVRVIITLAPGCPSLTTLTLQVNPLPLPNPVIPITTCVM